MKKNLIRLKLEYKKKLNVSINEFSSRCLARGNEAFYCVWHGISDEFLAIFDRIWKLKLWKKTYTIYRNTLFPTTFNQQKTYPKAQFRTSRESCCIVGCFWSVQSKAFVLSGKKKFVIWKIKNKHRKLFIFHYMLLWTRMSRKK
jgi:hypothetical protein